MENKEHPELTPSDPPAREPDAQETSTGFVDYFADILPDQPVTEDRNDQPSAPAALPEEPAQTPSEEEDAPDADPEVLSQIQSAIANIISQESTAQQARIQQAQEDPDPTITIPVPKAEHTRPRPRVQEVTAPEGPAEAAANSGAAEEPVSEVKEPVSSQQASIPVSDQPSEEAPVPDEPVSEEVPQEEPPLSPIPHLGRPPRKGRPKRRRGEFLFGIPQIAVTGVWLAIILITGVTLGRLIWVCASDVLAFNREDKVVTISVYESDTMDDIIQKLYDGQLIRYPGLFKLYADLAVDEGEIQPGIWDLNTLYDYHALVKMMSPSSSRSVVEDVLIPEGFSCRQIFALLEENRVCTAKDLAEYAASGELKDYWFLENVTRGDQYCLEGFLFPDTYDFYKNSSPRDVLEKMLDNFEYRFTEEMRTQLDTLNANVTKGTFDVHDVVIVASLIEKETANNEESPKIASVIYNRLFNWGGNPAYLNIDAAIIYALGGKTDLTTEDLKIDSPYNTYTHTGLTPGAIANPGLASLKAALNPETTNYYFYVLDPSVGTHKFSTTLDEHNAFIASLE